MKTLQTSLVLIALFALMLPCAHGEEHHHHEPAEVELCAVDHADCHACADVPCSESLQLVPVQTAPALEIPVREVQLVAIFKTDHPVPVDDPCHAGDLYFLQTVQLLI